NKYCINEPPVTLSVNETGGAFSGGGGGIVGNAFSPSIAGIGTHTVVYTIVNQYGCAAYTSQSTRVVGLSDASFTHLDSVYCEQDTVINLTPVTPGGVFTGAGVSTGTWNPNLSNVDTFNTISYFLTDSNGCSTFSSQSIYVKSAPDAS